MEFSMPVYISPPAKVKKLGIIKTVIANIFTESGAVTDLSDLVYNESGAAASIRVTADNAAVVLMKGPDGTGPNDYYLTFDKEDTWTRVLDIHGGVANGGLIHFMQPTGFEITGTFAINSVDPSVLVVTLDEDTIPSNTEQAIDRIVDPYNFNPRTFYNGNIPIGVRLLLLDNINEFEVGRVGADDAWINMDPDYTTVVANSIIEWNGSNWTVSFDPGTQGNTLAYVQHLSTFVQYRWDGLQWLRSFEGDYDVGYWRLQLD
jgi:hypothetical protein